MIGTHHLPQPYTISKTLSALSTQESLPSSLCTTKPEQFTFLLLCLNVQVHSVKYISSQLKTIDFLTEFWTLFNGVLAQHNSKLQNSCKYLQSYYMPCSTKHWVKMGQGFPYRHSVSRVMTHLPVDWQKLEYTTSSR